MIQRHRIATQVYHTTANIVTNKKKDIVLKCTRIEHGMEPILVYSDLASFKLYMGDVGLLSMKSGISQQTILAAGEIDNTFLGAICVLSKRLLFYVFPKQKGHTVRHEKHFMTNFLFSILKNWEQLFLPKAVRSFSAPTGQASTHLLQLSHMVN